MLTVLKLNVTEPPGVPSASRSEPSCVRMLEPFTVTVICEALGMGGSRKSQANVPSLAGTIVADSLLPAKEAKKLFALRLKGTIGFGKVAFGRTVTPTSLAEAGVRTTGLSALCRMRK